MAELIPQHDCPAGLILHEDEHLLVAHKPAGMNTHAPSPYAGAGLYEWLRDREPRWANLAIIHRLDKETSGILVFGKTTTANRALTGQFTRHEIAKKYVLLTDRPVKSGEFTVISTLTRAGEKYLSRPLAAGGERAETRFRVVETGNGLTRVEAEPVTGRTHQIRVHAASEGFPVLGDTLYGGTSAGRVCLHAAELALHHPGTGQALKFCVPPDFEADSRLALRTMLVDGRDTDACRLIQGAADGWPDWQVERLGDFLLSQSERPPAAEDRERLERLMRSQGAKGVYHKVLNRQVRRTGLAQASPQLLVGEPAPAAFVVQENGARFELSFNEGYSVGLFLDQRENRRRLLRNHIAADFPVFPAGPAGAEVLNTFAYTCGFSVCAARAGARTTSLDLSRKYLDWGRRNFALNGLDPGAHDFIFGDAFQWLRRLAGKGRVFDLVILDPPTFSQSRDGGAFRAEKDFGRLARAASPLVKPGGVLFAATNAARLEPEDFLAALETAASQCHRKILRKHYAAQPPDFPISREEPAYLKTVWLRID